MPRPPREPSGPIQVPLPGLLGLLQLKNLGANPSELMDQIRPTIDLLDLYLQSSFNNSTFQPAPVFGGGLRIAPTFGPFAEPRWIHNYTVWCPLAATDTINSFALTYVTQRVVGVSDGIHHPLENGSINGNPMTGANNGLMIGVESFWLAQGDSLGCFAYSAAGAAYQPTFTLRSTRAPA